MSLSLKQKLNNISSGLQTQVNTLSTETAEAVAFFHNIVSANADIAALEGTVSTNAASISGLQTTTSEQTSDIATIESDVATNAQSIIDLNTGFQADLATKQPNLINTSSVDAFEITLHNATLTDTKPMSYAGIVSIEGNISTLFGQVSTETSRAGTAEALNATNISNELDRALTVEGELLASINTETTNRTNQDTVLLNAINAEVARAIDVESTFNTNLSSETGLRIDGDSALQTNINGEATSRVSGDNKMCFCSMMEFEGLVAQNDFPFAAGYGSPSGVGFGLGVPFNYKVVGYSINCVSSDVSPSVEFLLEHYDFGSTTADPVDTCTMGSNKYVNKAKFVGPSHSGGNLVVKINTVSGLSDVNARYRLAVYLQSQDEHV
jgi:hypothetical protein